MGIFILLFSVLIIATQVRVVLTKGVKPKNRNMSICLIGACFLFFTATILRLASNNNKSIYFFRTWLGTLCYIDLIYMSGAVCLGYITPILVQNYKNPVQMEQAKKRLHLFSFALFLLVALFWHIIIICAAAMDTRRVLVQYLGLPVVSFFIIIIIWKVWWTFHEKLWSTVKFKIMTVIFVLITIVGIGLAVSQGLKGKKFESETKEPYCKGWKLKFNGTHLVVISIIVLLVMINCLSSRTNAQLRDRVVTVTRSGSFVSKLSVARKKKLKKNPMSPEGNVHGVRDKVSSTKNKTGEM